MIKLNMETAKAAYCGEPGTSGLLILAEEIAREAHAGQKYGEEDYIEAHIIPVVGLIACMGYNEQYQATGWIHDVFEDSTITPEEALNRGLPETVVAAAVLLDKTRHNMTKAEYLAGITRHPAAVVTKFADSSCNYANNVLRADGTRTGKVQEWLWEYSHNIAYLQPLLPDVAA